METRDPKQNIPEQHNIQEHSHTQNRDNEREEPFPQQTNAPMVALTQQMQML